MVTRTKSKSHQFSNTTLNCTPQGNRLICRKGYKRRGRSIVGSSVQCNLTLKGGGMCWVNKPKRSVGRKSTRKRKTSRKKKYRRKKVKRETAGRGWGVPARFS